MGSKKISGNILLSLIEQDANLLGCGEVGAHIIDGWYIVSSSSDWIKKNSQNIDSWLEVFKKLIPMSEAGVNAIRHEIFLMAFAESVFILEKGNVVLLKGDFPSDSVLECIEREGLEEKFSVGFCMKQ
ncbi:hypothetical protein [Microbulbifer sp. 2205BS26-8]|uniref:hypothetical protein n=1 Tax=Microbulbifer sp. 2205BS26-8 TaxID=3064386 RepID=UPI00273E22ED|nr:hypothetical protein [Microbulbifer sp. 2205BS26-8]MDP5209742.1 hypothetical protein [Microbulbifer sp. 2205BS26-8]